MAISFLISHLVSTFLLVACRREWVKAPLAKITVAGVQPVSGLLYRSPEKTKELINELIKDMEKDVIEPSLAACLSLIVFVNKADGSKHLFLDYRGVNTHLAQDVYSLPRLEEIVELASGNKYYVSVYLKEAYFQVQLHVDSRDLTTFSDRISLYRFKRLPFGPRVAALLFFLGTWNNY